LLLLLLLLLLLIGVVETKATKSASAKPSSRRLLLSGLTESGRSWLILTKSTEETSRLRLITSVCSKPTKSSRRWLLSLTESSGRLSLILLSERPQGPGSRLLCLPWNILCQCLILLSALERTKTAAEWLVLVVLTKRTEARSRILGILTKSAKASGWLLLLLLLLWLGEGRS